MLRLPIILILSAIAAGAFAAEPGASEATRAANATAASNLPASDEDEEFASRGLVAAPQMDIIRDAAGKPVWDFRAYEFMEKEAPPSVNPSLWRHTRLLAKSGLFKVSDRIYQVRGFDLANMSVILGDKGYILVDPLTSVENAAAALDLIRKTLGEKPVVAVIYTHSHADHFAGAKGVISAEDAASGKVRVIAPDGFVEHAVAENIIAGPAMSRRAVYQFGARLSPGEFGSIGSGIGVAVSQGTRSFIAPNDVIKTTGEQRKIDGLVFEFQMTPDSEAPAEMNFHIPALRALCLAENANATMHNVLTPRGALVRDSKRWADYLTQSLRLYGDKSDIMFTSHAWPRFGGDHVADFIANHRDAYKYLHDQTVRMMNAGLTGEEIADAIELPDSLSGEWYNRGYYGAMRHNSRAVYQRYMGWYDGNPAHLNQLPEEKTAPLYVEAMGGAKKLRKRAQKAIDGGDYRWAAELLDLAVFADPNDAQARDMLAGAHEQMAYQAESSLWRNMYLSAASELRNGPADAIPAAQSLDFIQATSTSMLFDLLSVRLAAERTPDEELKINFVFPERKEMFAVSIRNGVLVHEAGAAHAAPQATIALPRAAFLSALFVGADVSPKIDGDAGAWKMFKGLFEAPPANFNIVTP